MKNKRRAANLILFAVFAAVLAAAARPALSFFEALLADSFTGSSLRLAAVILYGMVAIVVLTAITGLLAVARGPSGATALLILIVAGACGAALYYSVQNMPEAVEATPGTPRPTVTPPVVEFTPTVKNENPETGTVMYRRYGNQQGTLIIHNNSMSDIYFRMTDRHGLLVLVFYVRAKETCEMPSPTGTYTLRCATGKNWVDEESYFGDSTRFRMFPKDYVLYGNEAVELTISWGLPEMSDITMKEFMSY